MGQETQETKVKRRRWPWLVGIFVVLMAAIVGLAPFAAQWAAQDWLRKNGAADAVIENIDFNPFTGQFALYNLSAGGGDQERLHIGYLAVDIDYLPLIDKRAVVRAIALRDTSIDVDATDPNELRIGALRIPLAGEDAAVEATPEPESAAPWHFGIQDIEIANVDASVAHPLRTDHVTINRLLLRELRSWTPDQPVPLDVDLIANEATVLVDVDTMPFAAEPAVTGSLRIDALNLSAYEDILADADVNNARGVINLDYKLDARLRDDGTTEIEAEGEFRAEGLHAEMPDLVFDQQLLKWQLRTVARVTPGEALSVVAEHHGSIDVEALSVETPQAEFAQQQVSWRGKSFLTMPPPRGEPLLNLQGDLQLSGTSAQLPDQALRVAQEQFTWTGDIQYGQVVEGDEALPLAMSAQVTMAGIEVKDTAAELTLASLEGLSLERLQLDGLDDARVNRVTLSKLRALWDGTKTDEGIAQLLSIDDITVTSGVYRDGNAVEIGDVVINALNVAVLGDKQGEFKWLSPLLAEDDGETNDEQSPAAAESEEVVADNGTVAEPLAIRIGLIKLAGDNWIVFEDEAVDPPFRTRLAPLELMVTDIDSSQPEKPAKLSVTTKIDQYADFNLAGTLHMFHEPISADLEGKLAGLDLPPLSSYSAQYIGYDLKRGRLDLDIDAKIDHGQIDSKNMVYLNKLKIVQNDAETAKKFSDQLAMPLDAAVGMLRDKQGNIKFELPVEGDITEPEFKLSGVINLALAKALKSAAMRYVTGALQPLGTVLFVSKVAGKAMQMKFEPVVFPAGQAEFDANGAAYLDKIGTLLQERPALSVTICGIAGLDDQTVLTQSLVAAAQPAEGAAAAAQPADTAQPPEGQPSPGAVDPELLREALLSLAEQRGKTVRDYLINQKGIAQERLFSCRPVFDDGEKVQPGVELSL